MPDSPKKTLRLPTKVASADAPYPPRRKPLRGGAVVAKHKSPVKAAASPAEPEPPARRSAPTPARSPARPANAARPAGESRPRPDGSPRSNVNPRANPRPRLDAGPRSDAAPRPHSGPRSNSGTRPDKGPRANVSQRPDSASRANTGSRSNFTPRSNADSRPKPSTKPKAPGPAHTLSTSDRPQSGVRVSKLLAAKGLCSRREADGYIERGWVFVNGERVTELGTRADADAVITLNTQARAMQQRLMTILLNKPVGYVSGQPEPGFTPAVTLILPENQLAGSLPAFAPGHLKGLAPERAYFTHMAHELPHAATCARLPRGVELAYDGLALDIELT